MVWAPNKDDLSPAQEHHFKIAGIPADRPGLLGEYPKAVYAADETGADRMHAGETVLLVANQFAVRTATVDNAEEEAEALAQGWALTPDLLAAQKKRDELADRDARIAELEAQLAGSPEMAGVRRGPGRPPRQQETVE